MDDADPGVGRLTGIDPDTEPGTLLGPDGSGRYFAVIGATATRDGVRVRFATAADMAYVERPPDLDAVRPAARSVAEHRLLTGRPGR